MTNRKDSNILVWVSDVYLGRRFSVARQTIWAWVKRREFPQPKKLSPGCTRWFLPDVVAWESRGLMAEEVGDNE